MLKHQARTKIGIALAAGTLVLAAGCAETAPPETEPVAPVEVAPAVRGPIQRIITARGILYPVNLAAVTPKISAPIEKFYVDRGDTVHRSQLLAVLEHRDLAAAVAEAKGAYEQTEASYRRTVAASLPEALAQAEADVRSSEEELQVARTLYENRKQLQEQGAIAQRLVDEANSAYVQAQSRHEVALKRLDSLKKSGQEEQIKEARAAMDAAKGRYEAAQVQLDYAQIRSPIDGVVTDRPGFAGDMATAGTPLLTIMDTSRLVARVNVPSDELVFLKEGDTATIGSSDTPAHLSGTVVVVSPALDPNSTTGEVWVEAANHGSSLRPGMSVEASIIAESLKDALLIPSVALLPSEGGEERVMVVGSDSVVHERQIEIGIQEDDKTQVVKGLEAGDQVVVQGGVGLEDGTQVSIEKAGKND
ncbi:MAG: efflux RND transporter periplasmic adaptor subunit [Acidobacteriota bacterium]